MTLSTFSITRTPASRASLWGNAQQLVVIVTSCTYQARRFLLAYGVDPAHVNPQLGALVFERMLPLDGLGKFLSVLLDGPDNDGSPEVSGDFILSQLAGQSGGGVIASSVDVTNADPPPPGPKLTVVFGLASSIASDQVLAEVAADAA